MEEGRTGEAGVFTCLMLYSSVLGTARPRLMRREAKSCLVNLAVNSRLVLQACMLYGSDGPLLVGFPLTHCVHCR